MFSLPKAKAILIAYREWCDSHAQSHLSLESKCPIIVSFWPILFQMIVSHRVWPQIYKCHFTFSLYIGKGCLIFDLVMVTLHALDETQIMATVKKTGCPEVFALRISVKYQSQLTFTVDKCYQLKSSRNKRRQ